MSKCFQRLALIFFSTLACSCHTSWIWDSSPNPNTQSDLSGRISIVDSSGTALPQNRADISVYLIDPTRNDLIVDSTLTNSEGDWRMSKPLTGAFNLVEMKPGFSVYGYPIGGETGFLSSIAGPLKHAVTLDSFTAFTIGGVHSLRVYGHDPFWTNYPRDLNEILICLDTVNGMPSDSRHSQKWVAALYDPDGLNGNLFWGNLPLKIDGEMLSASDSLYIVAYAIDPVEGSGNGVWPWSQQFRTCGPRSNVFTIPNK
jgi:hypothetical protein